MLVKSTYIITAILLQMLDAVGYIYMLKNLRLCIDIRGELKSRVSLEALMSLGGFALDSIVESNQKELDSAAAPQIDDRHLDQ
jgi:hypothetical protein